MAPPAREAKVNDTVSVAETLGHTWGAAVAPLFEAISRRRGASTFHPRGDQALAECTALGVSQWRPLADALTGRALVRLSNALWRSARWPDALGCAVCLLDERGEPAQNLLFATIRRPYTMPLAPFFTRVGDYLANRYYAVSPFLVPGLGAQKTWLRLTVERRPTESAPHRWAERRARLENAIEREEAVFVIEASASPWRNFTAVARMRLSQLLPIETPRRAFDPFLNQRGITPCGFIHALRHATYARSRSGRADLAMGELPSSPDQNLRPRGR